MIKAIFFDAGGVLVRDRSDAAFRKFAHYIRVPLHKAKAAYFSPDRERLIEEGKITRTEFYARVCKKLGRPPLPRHAFVMLTPKGKPPIIAHTFWVIKQLKRNGYIVGVISNIMTARRASRFWSLYGRLFRPLVLSYEVEAKKPNRKIFEIARRRARVKFSEMVFIDDHQKNIVAAKKFGIAAFVYKNPKHLVQSLRRFGVKI